MRRLFPLLLAGLLLLGGGFWLVRQAESPLQVPPGTSPAQEHGTAPPADPHRADPARIPIANEPGAQWMLQFRDAEDHALAAAQLLDLRDGSTLATADAEGRLLVAPSATDRFLCTAPGHLARQLRDPEAQQLAATGRCEIRLVRDHWTIPCAFRFIDPEGRPVSEVQARFLPRGVPPPSMFGVAASIEEPEVRAAFDQHASFALLARLGLGWHLGIESAMREFRADGLLRLRFAAAGPYLLSARGPGDLVLHEQVFVRAGQLEPQQLRMVRGITLHGVVVAPDGAPLAGARIQLAAGSFAAETDSGPEGRFELPALPPASVRLIASHPDCEPQEVGPFVAGGEPVRIVLPVRAPWTLRGVVRSRGARAPVAQAAVAFEHGGQQREARTGPDGRFELVTRAPGGTLQIGFQDHLRWVEIVGPESPELAIDLWPATARARAEAGLTALLEGQVVGPDGKPRPGFPIQVDGDWAEPPARIPPGRSIVEGAHIAPPLFLAADGDGRFSFEWPGSGTLRLKVGAGGPEHATPLTVDVRPGRIQTDLVLRTLR